MNCPDTSIIGWLFDIVDRLDWRITPREVLLTEREYPGLMHDLSIEAWQRRLIKKQIDGDESATGENEV